MYRGSFEDIELFDMDLNKQSPVAEQRKNSWRKVDSDFLLKKYGQNLS